MDFNEIIFDMVCDRTNFVYDCFYKFQKIDLGFYYSVKVFGYQDGSSYPTGSIILDNIELDKPVYIWVECDASFAYKIVYENCIIKIPNAYIAIKEQSLGTVGLDVHMNTFINENQTSIFKFSDVYIGKWGSKK